MAAQKKKEINLLLKDQFQQTPLGKFIKWALNFGKYIVIIVELIVVIAFVARFKLDQDLNQLGESISEKQNIIASFGALESNVRIVQKQLAVIKEELQNQPVLAEKLSELSSVTPKDTFFEELNFSKDSVSFSGASPTEASLATLISEMQKSKIFTNIVVDSISSGGVKNPTIVFKVKASFKGTP